MGEWLASTEAEPPWLHDPLGFLLEPTSPDAFFRDHYESAPLIAARDEPERFSRLLTLAELDAFIDGADLRQGMLELVRHPSRIDSGRYLSADGRVIASAVVDEYLKGATIILPQLHESMPQLGDFCRALEAVFSCHVQTNAYLTPPGHQGFAVHYDSHDVFVLQIAGSKCWSLYGAPVAAPYRGEPFDPAGPDPGNVTESVTLKPGGCFYLPRGYPHDALNAGDEPSLHITVGLIVRTWADLMLESVAELTSREPDFRRSLPPGYANGDFDRAVAERQFERLARLVGEKASMDGAFDLMAHNFLRERRPKVARVIAGGAGVPADTDLFRRRRLVLWQLADDAGKLALIGPGGDLHFDDGDGEALELALSGEVFAMGDLKCADPLRLVRKLWAHGYLERVSA